MTILAHSASVMTPSWVFVMAICHMQTGWRRIPSALLTATRYSADRVTAGSPMATKLNHLGSDRDKPPPREGRQDEKDAAPLRGRWHGRDQPAAPGKRLIGRSTHAAPTSELELLGEERFQLHRRHLRMRPGIRFPHPPP